MRDVFNAATYFIDRHIDEGRGHAIAIESANIEVSYAMLCEQVNRTGSGLRTELGVRAEERVLLLMLDGPEMVFAFFGAIKIGAVPVPDEHDVDGCGLRVRPARTHALPW